MMKVNNFNEEKLQGYKELYKLTIEKTNRFVYKEFFTYAIILILVSFVNITLEPFAFGTAIIYPFTIYPTFNKFLKKAKKELKNKYPYLDEVANFTDLEVKVGDYSKINQDKTIKECIIGTISDMSKNFFGVQNSGKELIQNCQEKSAQEDIDDSITFREVEEFRKSEITNGIQEESVIEKSKVKTLGSR